MGVDLSASRQAKANRALSVGGFGLALVYLAAWFGLGGTSEAPQGPPPTAPNVVSYLVTTADGEEEVLTVPASDPAAGLREAERLYGPDLSLRRIDAAEASAVGSKRGAPGWSGALLVFPVAFVALAWLLRRREGNVAAVFEALAPTFSADLAQLREQTGLGDAAIRRALDRIARRGWADLAWHGDRVADQRLSSQSLTLQFCPNCNEPTVARIRADLFQVPRCNRCMSEYDRRQLARLVREPASRLLHETGARIEQEAGRFSIPAFAAMALLLPPAALAYAWLSAR